MTPRRTIASYDQLQDVFRRRKEELGLSNDQVDDICGFTRGHFDKLIGGKKNFGPGTLAPLMAAFNMVLVAEAGAIVPEVTITEQRNESQVRRQRSSLRCERKAHLERVLSDPDYFRKAGRKGGRARAANQTANQRKASARKAGRARAKRAKERQGSKHANPPQDSDLRRPLEPSTGAPPVSLSSGA